MSQRPLVCAIIIILKIPWTWGTVWWGLYFLLLDALSNPDFWEGGEIFWCIINNLCWSYKPARKLIDLFLLVQQLRGSYWYPVYNDRRHEDQYIKRLFYVHKNGLLLIYTDEVRTYHSNPTSIYGLHQNVFTSLKLHWKEVQLSSSFFTTLQICNNYDSGNKPITPVKKQPLGSEI